ncbi:hypothetical protein [Rhizobium sp. 2MFCol3.1]|uniref:hypothetical protein n=1 Tax=Rhizobium sp. 2MFCol3.1 TaxID=1246459 RepID=UPI00037C935C|nr:hypothetical protein [Rhizobium sp. 2MFCol3.1]
MRLNGVATHDHHTLSDAGQALVICTAQRRQPFDAAIEVTQRLVVIDRYGHSVER